MTHEYLPTEPARWPLVVWGDGLMGEIIEEFPEYINEYGDKMIRMRVRLEEALMARAGLSYRDLDLDDSFDIAYPASWLKTLSDDPARPVKLLKCGFWGDPSALTRENEDLHSNIYSLERIIDSLQSQVAFLHSKIDELSTNIYEHDKKEIERFGLYKEIGGKTESEALSEMLEPR